MITDDQIKLMIGSLLHDIGKVVYRSGDGRNHSQSGYEYLKNEAHISDDEILNCKAVDSGRNPSDKIRT
jgi:CRISPR-associated protein Csm1